MKTDYSALPKNEIPKVHQLDGQGNEYDITSDMAGTKFFLYRYDQKTGKYTKLGEENSPLKFDPLMQPIKKK